MIISNKNFTKCFADKADTIYEMSKEHHQNVLHANITKTYQKAPPNLDASTKLEAKIIFTRLKISHRVERITRTSAFVTFKDTQTTFIPIHRVVQ